MPRKYFIVVGILVVVAAAALFHARTRPIPFTSAGWRSGDARLRFRMEDSLREVYASGALPDRATIDDVLGPDDEWGGDPTYRYFRLRTWYGNPWCVRIRFDDQGKVGDCVITAD